MVRTPSQYGQIGSVPWNDHFGRLLPELGGDSPFMSTTYDGALRALAEAGADSGIADREGVTALAHAEARGYREIAELIRAAGKP